MNLHRKSAPLFPSATKELDIDRTKTKVDLHSLDRVWVLDHTYHDDEIDTLQVRLCLLDDTLLAAVEIYVLVSSSNTHQPFAHPPIESSLSVEARHHVVLHYSLALLSKLGDGRSNHGLGSVMSIRILELLS